MRTNYYNHVILLFLLLCFHSYAAPGVQKQIVLNVDSTFKVKGLNDYISVISTQEKLNIKSLKNQLEQQSNKKRFDDYLWISFNVQNISSKKKNIILELNNPLIDKYELYIIEENEKKLIGKGGDHYKFQDRTISNRRFLEEFSIEPHAKYKIALYVEDLERDTSIPLVLWDKNAFLKNEVRQNTLYNVYFGGLIFIGLFSILIGIFIHQKIYYAYGIYALVMAFYLFTYLGFSYQFLYPEKPSIKRILDDFIDLPIYLTFVIFASSFFDIRNKNKRLHFFVRIQYILIIFAMLFWLLTKGELQLKKYITISYILLFFTIAIILSMVFSSFKSNKKNAYIFLTACIIIFSSAILFALADAGVIPMDTFPTNPLLIGSIGEFGVFSIALVFEANRLYLVNDHLLKEKAQFQKRILESYIKGVEKERLRLSCELHDNIGSQLALLKNNFGTKFPKENLIKEDLQKLYASIRDFSHELSPGEFNIVSFDEYLKAYLAKFKASHKINVQAFIDHKLSSLPVNIKTQIFRIVQEASNNVYKHAKATTFEVQLISHSNEIVITLDDDGVGFDYSEIDYMNSKGLANMKTRAKSMDASFELNTSPGKGTHITISIPIQ